MREPSDQELERLFKLDDTVGPARPIDGARASSIVDAALRAAGFPPAGPSGGTGGGGASHAGAGARGMRAGKMGAGKLSAGKLGALAGGTLAAVAAVAWLAVRGTSPPEAPDVAVAPTSAPVIAPLPSAPEIATPPSAPEIATPSTGPAPAQEPAAPLVDRPPIRRRHRTHPRGKQVATAEPVAEPRPAADLLAAANAARAQHQWRSADALYTRVVETGHDALATQTALVASGSLHLEHLGDPRGAARLFRAALARNAAGALAEDARWGLAETARALDDTAGELRALDDFLAHHASSALAPRARERRDALRGAP